MVSLEYGPGAGAGREKEQQLKWKSAMNDMNNVGISPTLANTETASIKSNVHASSESVHGASRQALDDVTSKRGNVEFGAGIVQTQDEKRGADAMSPSKNGRKKLAVHVDDRSVSDDEKSAGKEVPKLEARARESPLNVPQLHVKTEDDDGDRDRDDHGRSQNNPYFGYRFRDTSDWWKDEDDSSDSSSSSSPPPNFILPHSHNAGRQQHRYAINRLIELLEAPRSAEMSKDARFLVRKALDAAELAHEQGQQSLGIPAPLLCGPGDCMWDHCDTHSSRTIMLGCGECIICCRCLARAINNSRLGRRPACACDEQFDIGLDGLDDGGAMIEAVFQIDGIDSRPYREEEMMGNVWRTLWVDVWGYELDEGTAVPPFR